MPHYQQRHVNLKEIKVIKSVRRVNARPLSSFRARARILMGLFGLLMIAGFIIGVTLPLIFLLRNTHSSTNDTITVITTTSSTTSDTTSTTSTTSITTDTTSTTSTTTTTTSTTTDTTSTTSTTSTTTTTTSTTTDTTSTTSTTTTTTSTTTDTTSTTTTSTTTDTTSTTSTATSTTSTTTTTTQTTITFAPVGIYALTIPTCATWNQTGITAAGNQNGTSGSNVASLASPASIFVDNNNILYIADRDNNRIIKYYPNSTSGIVVAGNGTAGNDPSELNGPKGVAVDQYGSIIVADSNNYRIQKFLVNSTVGITLASNTSYNPLGQMRDLHIDINNNIYITDSDNNQVVKYIPYSSIGIVLAGGTPAGSAAYQLKNPFGNFVDGNGTLYVADDGNQRVLKYVSGSPNGSIVAGVNSTFGSNLTQLHSPISVTVDNNGYIYVVDQANNRIVKWTTNYSAGGVCIIGCTGTSGTALNQLNGPRDLKFDQYGNIYVDDQGNHRILKFMIQLPTSTCPTSG